jgi:hypothetical protein
VTRRAAATRSLRRRWVLVRATMLAVLLLGGLAACTPPPSCRTATFTTSTAPDNGWSDQLHAYADNSTRTDDLTGADGAHSTILPDGRRLWAFGDTFLGTINASHGRPLTTPMISNTYVEEVGGAFSRTLIGGTSTAPTALFRPPTADTIYWPGEAVVEGTKFRVLVNEFSGTGLDLTHKGTGFATLTLPGLALDTTAPPQVFPRGGVLYSTVLTEGSWTYFYGTKSRELHVARAPTGSVLGPWEYRTAAGSWSLDPAQAAPVTASAGGVDSMKVVKLGRCFVLLTFLPGVWFNTGDIRAYVADAPDGPWSAGQHVHTIPEAPRSDVLWYGAWAHPSLRSGTSVVTSYSVNGWGDGNFTDVHRYRNRFLKVTFTGLPA